MSFQPGDAVVCVSTRPIRHASPTHGRSRDWRREPLPRGCYLPHPTISGGQLVGADHSPGHGWQAWRFRKVVSGDREFIERLRAREFERA